MKTIHAPITLFVKSINYECHTCQTTSQIIPSSKCAKKTIEHVVRLELIERLAALCPQ